MRNVFPFLSFDYTGSRSNGCNFSFELFFNPENHTFVAFKTDNVFVVTLT